MAQEKVYFPETIDDNPFPGQTETPVFDVSSPGTKDNPQPSSIKDNKTPTKKIAVELIGSALNTKSKKILAEFEFTESGAIQIGKYENGVSGDVRLTPNGITARNLSGLTTFALDGDTGNATFAGTIQAGTFVSGAVVVGDNRVIIDGANSRIMVYDDDGIPRILIGYQAGGF